MIRHYFDIDAFAAASFMITPIADDCYAADADAFAGISPPMPMPRHATHATSFFFAD